MTKICLKKLFEERQYHEILELVTRLEDQGELTSLSLITQVDHAYYKSRALERLGKYKEALLNATRIRDDLVPPDERVSNLKLLIGRIYALIQLGRYDEALMDSREGETVVESLTDTEQDTGMYWIASLYNVEADIYFRKGERNIALDYYKRSLTLFEKIDNPRDIARTLYLIGECYDWKELNIALDYYKRALMLYEKLDDSLGVADSILSIGYTYFCKNELVTALNYYQRALNLYEKTGHSKGTAVTLIVIGEVYRSKGELDTALEYFQRTQILAEAIGDSWNIANSSNQIGIIYNIRGELDTALKFFLRALTLFEKLGDLGTIAWSLSNMGHVYYSKGELDYALENFLRALSLTEKLGRDLPISEYLFYIIIILLDLQDQEQAQIYLSRLQALHDRNPEKIIQHQFQLARALVLKQSKRIVDKAQAQRILSEMVAGKQISFDLAVLATTHLCELLLVELKAFGEPEVLKEAKILVQDLYVLARDQQSFSLTVKALLLRAKFAIIEGDLQQAQEYLDQSMRITGEKKMGLMAQRVKNEQKLLETELSKWQELIRRNAPLEERLEQSKLEEYVKEARKVVGSFNSRKNP